MFTDELSTDALMACDEAERIASLPNQVVDGTGSAGLGMQQLPPPTPIEYPGSFSEKPGITAVPGATESPPGISNRHTQQWDSDEFDLLLSDHLSQEVLLAYDEAQSLDFVPVLPIPSSTTLSPVTALDTSISEFEPPISTPLSSNSPSTFLPVPFSFRPLTPLRNITNCGPRIAANKLVMLGSPISISSDSSDDRYLTVKSAKSTIR
ncbi:hypothetical protein C8F04DRAFT_456767 [Mycena alexandri]|uniref:Uncharacterized protein n=1 Tax=Mycena alexandri TaxID=1745969 RepID=A0AAD6T413_9AGAR|nr:hypothetical protein C8F04DRAFT_456767 [Mycena alexandri]